MALLRYLIPFFIFCVPLSHAETISATSGFISSGVWGATQSAACVAGWGAVLPSGGVEACGTPYNVDSTCYVAVRTIGASNCPGVWNTGITASFGCPVGQNWTLSGSNCTRPDCVSPQVRDPSNGQCITNPCSAGGSTTGSFFAGWRVGPAANQVIGSDGGAYTFNPNRCQSGCLVTVTVGSCNSSAGYVNAPVPITCSGTGVFTGGICVNDDTGTPSTTPTVPNHRPVCASGEGVLTSSSGTVACVPSGTPASAPVVNKTKSTQVFPDGSTRTTDTIYTRDPVTQVQDTQQSITNTPATGGGTGMAGTPGTTSTSGSAQPSSGTDPDAADFCQKNGQLQICKGDMNLESTQKEVRDYIKSLTDPAATPYTGIENAKQSTQSDADLQAEIDKFTAASNGTFSPDASSKSSWDSAMSSGWFDPVTRVGCTPYTAQIGGRTWTLDICPTAEKVSVISEYVIWFLLVVGIFVVFTGGAIQRSN